MRFLFIIIILLFSSPSAMAEETTLSCDTTANDCLIDMLGNTADTIEEPAWRDRTYRELAKILTKEKQTVAAIALIGKIENPDTKAMTIRGIGMAAAEMALRKEEYDSLFITLAAEAEKITHTPSHEIALTYIAMAQAQTGDDAGAMTTTARMKNPALRNKAYGETAEIQAERGNLTTALESLAAIDDPAFRNKAYRLVSKIFADNALYEKAVTMALKSENSYHKSQAILYILVRKISPEEVSVE